MLLQTEIPKKEVNVNNVLKPYVSYKNPNNKNNKLELIICPTFVNIITFKYNKSLCQSKQRLILVCKIDQYAIIFL